VSGPRPTRRFSAIRRASSAMAISWRRITPRSRPGAWAGGLTTRQLALEYFAKRDFPRPGGSMMPSHYSSPELKILSVPTPTGAQADSRPAASPGASSWTRKNGVRGHHGWGDAANAAKGDFLPRPSASRSRRSLGRCCSSSRTTAYGISTPTRQNESARHRRGRWRLQLPSQHRIISCTLPAVGPVLR